MVAEVESACPGPIGNIRGSGTFGTVAVEMIRTPRSVHPCRSIRKAPPKREIQILGNAVPQLERGAGAAGGAEAAEEPGVANVSNRRGRW